MFRQIGSNPVFQYDGEIEEDFVCSKCGALLVSGFRRECLVDIGIICSTCSKVNRTPALPLGEITGPRAVIFDDKVIDVDQTRIYPAGTLFVSSAYRRREDDIYFPIKTVTPWNHSRERLRSVEERLIGLTDGRHKLHRRAASKQIAQGLHEKAARDYPAAWAFLMLERHMASRSITFSDAERVAYSYISALHTVIEKWKRHPCFNSLMSELKDPGTFRHNMIVFSVAGYLCECRNRVGIAIPSGGRGRLSDMYIWCSNTIRLRLEIKVPAKLCWPSAAPTSLDDMVKIIGASIAQTKGQVSQNNRGLVTIGSSLLAPNEISTFFEAVELYIGRHGRRHPGIGLLAGACFTTVLDLWTISAGLEIRPFRNKTFEESWLIET